MPRLHTHGRRGATAIALMFTLLAGGLTACGAGSSSTAGTGANAAATSAAAHSASTTPATPATTSGSPSSTSPTPGSTSTAPAASAARSAPTRFGALRECLQRAGVTPPRATPSGVPQLPKGMTRAQYREALQKCGASFRGPHAVGGRRALKTPAFRAALAIFVACLHQNGANVPAPNTNGNGPIFNTKGIDTSSPKFRAALAKCRPVLAAALRARTGRSATSK